MAVRRKKTTKTHTAQELRELVRSHTPAAIEFLARVLNDENQTTGDRLYAAVQLIKKSLADPVLTVAEQQDGKMSDNFAALAAALGGDNNAQTPKT